MSQTARFRETLRRLAMIDETFVEDAAGTCLGPAGALALDPRTAMLLQLGALVATGASPECVQWSTGRAMAAGVAADEIADVLLAVGHNRRFWPSMRALREITTSGELGTILHVEGHNSNENSQGITAGWRLSPEESPGGGLTGAGLHVLDAFVSLVGPARQVYARLSPRQLGPPPLDSAMLAIDFANGVTGMLATIRATPFYWRVHVFGTNGSAEVLDEVTLVRRRSGTKPETIIYPAVDVLANELAAFADAVERKQPFPIPQQEVLATLAAFDGALQSMQAGQSVPLDP